MHRTWVSIVAFALLLPIHTTAAQRIRLRAGRQVSVRSSVTRPDRIEGTFERSTNDTLYAQTLGLGRTVAIPVASVTRLELWTRRSNVGRGALMGAMLGGGIGFFVAGSASGPYFEPSLGLTAGFTASLAAFGALLGAGIGAASGAERWEEVALDRVRLEIVPMRDQAYLGFTVVF